MGLLCNLGRWICHAFTSAYVCYALFVGERVGESGEEGNIVVEDDEQLFNIWDPHLSSALHGWRQSLAAHFCFLFLASLLLFPSTISSPESRFSSHDHVFDKSTTALKKYKPLEIAVNTSYPREIAQGLPTLGARVPALESIWHSVAVA